MTLDDLCMEAARLTPRAASMASVMLQLVGPLSSAWQRALFGAVGSAARNQPFTTDEVDDLLRATLEPAHRADWLIGNSEFAEAHSFVVDSHLAAEKWKSIVMRLLDDADSNTCH